MRTLIIAVLLAGLAAAALAQPDPRDSIILESKTVAPGAHPGSASDTAAYVYLRVWITNKDSLTFVTLALIERTRSGGAYIILGRPRYFNGMASRLTSTLVQTFPLPPIIPPPPGLVYNSESPDSFLVGAFFDPLQPATIEPPNAVRKALWDIKFDSVWSNPGTVEFDTGRVVQSTSFTNTVPVDMPVHFVKSVITVVPKGDLDLDGQLSAADVVLLLNCVFFTDPTSAAASPCDLNCDRQRSPADAVWLLQAVFLGRAFPC